MLLIIDGDNAPGSKTKDIGLLNEHDKVYIVYAANNNYYSKAENRLKIENSCKCKVNWMSVPPGNCSADLGACMKLATLLQDDSETIICLISDDKHFDVMASIAKQMYCDVFVVRESTVSDAVFKYKLLEQSSLQDIKKCFKYMFGKKRGSDLYESMCKLILQEYNSNLKKFGLFNKLKIIIGRRMTGVENL